MVVGVAALLAPWAAEATPFTVATGETRTAAQAVTGTETGTIQAGGTLSPTATAIAVNGAVTGVTINNAGTVTSGNRGIDTNTATSVSGLTINNFVGAMISSVDNAIRLNTAIGNGTVVINNAGTIISSTKQAIDISGNTSPAGTVQITNSATGIVRAMASDAIKIGSGTTVITNSGLIDSTNSANRAINLNVADLSTVTSLQVINNAGGIIRSTDDAIRVTGTLLPTTGSFLVDNAGTITSATGQAIDFNDIASTTATTNIINRATGVISAAAADAVRPGQGATVTNYGLIFSDGPVGASNDGIDWQGHTGTVLNMAGGTISGFRHGITSDTGVNVTNAAGGVILGRNGSGVGSDGTGTVVNYGRITGAYNGSGTGDGDGVDIDFAATITNYGTIEGTGAGGFDSGNRANNSEGISIGGGTVSNFGTISGASYGIVVNDDSNTDNSRSGSAATTITNNAGGTIIGQNGFAIRLENKTGTAADNDTIVNRGTIIGNGAIPDPNAVVLLGNGAVDPGSVGTLNGVVYTGTGSARFIRGDGSAIQMGEGADVLTNYGTIIGNNGRAVNMEGGNDTVNIMKGSRIVGLVDGGAGTDTLNYNKVGLSEAKRAALQAGQTVNIGGTLYTSFEIVTGASQSFSSLASASGLGVAGVFDNLPVTGTTSSAAMALIDSVASANDVGAALSQLSPAAYQGLGRMTMDSASQTTSMVGQRLTQGRFGGNGDDLAGASAALAMADGGLFDRHGADLDRRLGAITGLPESQATALNESNWLNTQQSAYDALAYAPTKALPGMRTVTPQADHGVFVTSSLSVSHDNARADAPETRATTANVVVGADWRVTDSALLGVFGGYAYTRGDLDTLGSTTKISTRSVGGYAAWEAPTWFATLIGLYGWSDYDNNRVALGAIDTSSFAGTHYTVRGTVGTDIRVSGWVVTPELGLQYTKVSTDAFAETGGASVLNVAADSSESLRSSLGARFAYDYRINGGVLTPEFRLAWLHEFSDGVRGINASFADVTLPGSFVSATGSALRDRAVVGTGVSGRLGALTTISLNYDAVIGSDDSLAHQFTGRLKHSF
jgi:outer membrane autotransporter protein